MKEILASNDTVPLEFSIFFQPVTVKHTLSGFLQAAGIPAQIDENMSETDRKITCGAQQLISSFDMEVEMLNKTSLDFCDWV